MDFYGVEEHFGDLPHAAQTGPDRANAAGSKSSRTRSPTTPALTTAGPPIRPRPPGSTARWPNHLENTWQTWTIADPNPPPDKLKATLDGWFINILPDLNQNDPETAAYLIQNSLWWIGQTGLDAVRQDTLPYVPRTYWSRWTAALKREHPRLTILGEMWDGNPKLVSFFQGGRKAFDGVDTGVDTLFDFPLVLRHPRRLRQTPAHDPPLRNAGRGHELREPARARHLPRPARHAAVPQRDGRRPRPA